MKRRLSKAEKRALEYGIDLELLFDNLELTVEQRIDRLQDALDTLQELKQNFRKSDGIPQKSSQSSR